MEPKAFPNDFLISKRGIGDFFPGSTGVVSRLPPALLPTGLIVLRISDGCNGSAGGTGWNQAESGWASLGSGDQMAMLYIVFRLVGARPGHHRDSVAGVP